MGCCVLADKSCDAATGGAGGCGKKPAKSKRVRTIFTPEQLERLEAEFKRQQYMVGPERLYLAHTLQLTEAQVQCPQRTELRGNVSCVSLNAVSVLNRTHSSTVEVLQGKLSCAPLTQHYSVRTYGGVNVYVLS
jgi:hypothetical protein